MKIALANYPIERMSALPEFFVKQAKLLEAARSRGARVAVWPEFLGMELAGGLPDAVALRVFDSARALQPLLPGYCEGFSALARDSQMLLVAGSFLVEVAHHRFANRCLVFTPDGRCLHQDKLILTQFEVKAGCIEPGQQLHWMEFEGLRFGINVCYDIEFPQFTRSLIESGADLVLVPSCTDTPAGAMRVRVGCQARALENQCLVGRAVTVGDAHWSAVFDHNTGMAGLHAPIDHGFPSDGVLAESPMHEPWCVVDLPLGQLAESRMLAQVHNRSDWERQYRPELTRAKRM